MWPWNKYSQLIEALYEEINGLKKHILKLEKEREFAKALKQLKVDIKEDIIKEIDTDKISKKIAEIVRENLKKSKVGLV